MCRGAVGRLLFPPLQQALVKALACEAVAHSQQPLSRQSLSDLQRRLAQENNLQISRSTIWRILRRDVIKPWPYQHWLFPRDPQFAWKAGRILDLYAGHWNEQPLEPQDVVLSCDEKTSIQARQRLHPEHAPQPRQARRVEAEYKRQGALQYLAAWDVVRGKVLGRCEARNGIASFGRLVDDILAHDEYRSAKRVFLVVDNGSAHRGASAIQRLQQRDPRLVLVHTPVHASWLNQVEVYFSILQRKVLTPNDFPNLEALRIRLALYADLTNQNPKPFQWKFTRQQLEDWLERIKPQFEPENG